MKNTRKKLLVSSIAMLSVAAISLSSATFAWFTASTEAYADGMYVRTTKVSNLEINSKLDAKWRTHVDYKVGSKTANQLLMPSSTVNGADWFYANADENTSFKATTATKYTGTIGDDTNFCDYYFADQLNIKNSGQAACNDVQIKIEGFVGDYTRVAVVPVTEKGGTTIAEDGKTFADYVIDTDGVAYNVAKGTTLLDEDGNAVAENVQAITPSTTTTITVGNMVPEAVKYYNVYVWFEGQDVECENANSGQNIPALKFTVSGTSESDSN
jgi:hypothetical protein